MNEFKFDSIYNDKNLHCMGENDIKYFLKYIPDIKNRQIITLTNAFEYIMDTNYDLDYVNILCIYYKHGLLNPINFYLDKLVQKYNNHVTLFYKLMKSNINPKDYVMYFYKNKLITGNAIISAFIEYEKYDLCDEYIHIIEFTNICTDNLLLKILLGKQIQFLPFNVKNIFYKKCGDIYDIIDKFLCNDVCPMIRLTTLNVYKNKKLQTR